MSIIKIAATQFDLKPVAKPDDFWERVTALCEKAAQNGACVVQFPEYFSLSWLLSLNDGDFSKALYGFKKNQKKFDSEFSKLAKKLNLVIAAGTVPFVLKKKLVNRCYIYLPFGKILHQDKQNMTRFENEEWKVSSGEKTIVAFEHKGAKFGVAICYDVEFPSYTEKLVAKNVDVILVPSCTDDMHGYWRVRLCAQARAVESQSYVSMSSIVGGDPDYEQINVHYGQAGFFTPSDVGFPEGGVLDLGKLNSEDVHVSECDLAKLKEVRIKGTVLNRRDSRRR